MPKDESYRIRCIDCKRGINGSQDCGAGWYEVNPSMGCYIGEALPDSDPKKGKINKKRPNEKFYEKTCDGATQLHKARKEHTCDFCGAKIYPGDEYLATFVRNPEYMIRPQRFFKSCMSCRGSIVAMCGD